MSVVLSELAELDQIIDRHWQTHRPTVYADLKAQGQLEESIRQAAEDTRGAVRQLMAAGKSFPEAWAAVREEWAILPAEGDADLDDAALRKVMRAVLGIGDEDELGAAVRQAQRLYRRWVDEELL